MLSTPESPWECKSFWQKKYGPNAVKRAPETRVNMSPWTFELTKLRNNLKIILNNFSTLDLRLVTVDQKANYVSPTDELGPHKDRRKLWPGWELNSRPSGLITAAPWPPTELQCQTGAGRGKWRCQLHGNEPNMFKYKEGLRYYKRWPCSTYM